MTTSARSVRYWLAVHPDVSRPIGGVKQIHRLAEALGACGREATLIQQQQDFHPGWFRSEVTTTSVAAFRSRTDLDPTRDVLILPETFLPDLLSYARGLPKILFNQNGAYSFGLGSGRRFPPPQEVLALYRHPELLHVLCVSEQNQQLFTRGFGLGEARVSRLVNGIEAELFQPAARKHRQVALMSRKNSADAEVVMQLLRAQSWWRDGGWKLAVIQNLPQQQVAAVLGESLVFLSFGHPEGFGLPVAEALASACAVAGYSGLGGRELFQLAADHSIGVEVAYGDWLGFVDAVAAFHRSLSKQGEEVAEALQQASDTVRQRYSAAAMQASVASAMARWEAQLGC